MHSAKQLNTLVDRIHFFACMSSEEPQMVIDYGDSVILYPKFIKDGCDLFHFYGVNRIDAYTYFEFTNAACTLHIKGDEFKDCLEPWEAKRLKKQISGWAKERREDCEIRVGAKLFIDHDDNTIIYVQSIDDFRLDTPLELRRVQPMRQKYNEKTTPATVYAFC